MSSLVGLFLLLAASWVFQNLKPATLGFSEPDARDTCLLEHVCVCSYVIFSLVFLQHCFYPTVVMLQQQPIQAAQATASLVMLPTSASIGICRGVQAPEDADLWWQGGRRYDEEHAKEPAEGHGRHEPSQHANEYGPNEQDASAPCAQTDGWPRSPSGSHETDGGYEMSHHFWLVYECQICGLILHQLESMRRV